MDKAKEVVYSGKVLDMLTVANEFCLFVEESKDKSPGDIVFYLHKILPLLYLKGSLLPDVQVSDPSINERYVSEENWESVYNVISAKFVKNNKYTFTQFPYEEKAEQEIESIADNISDIYQDMKDFVILYQKPQIAAKENAVKECKTLFGNHWGIISLKIIYALHFLSYDNSINQESGISF